jgi:hypothetical protein
VDIDGTLANIDHRLHHMDRTKGKPNWGKFFAEMDKDTPNKWCVDLIEGLKTQFDIVLCSGRPDNFQEVTRKWLTQIWADSKSSPIENLFMRRRDDSRQDNIVKEIILDFELKTRYGDLLFVDDRTQVVEMYRSHGYTVLQCAKGDF